jgi:site-specific DNA recombinase
VIREAATRLLAGESIRSICTNLNERGQRTVTWVEWTQQTLRRMLASGRISGQREHRGVIVGPAEWPAIITAAETERIRALFSDPRRRTNRTARRYLLARLLRCGLCGSTLVSRPRADGTRRYVFASGPGLGGCGRITILAEHVEQVVTEAVLFRLDTSGPAPSRLDLGLLRTQWREYGSPRSASQSDHAHHTAGGLDQPSAADDRHICDG